MKQTLAHVAALLCSPLVVRHAGGDGDKEKTIAKPWPLGGKRVIYDFEKATITETDGTNDTIQP